MKRRKNINIKIVLLVSLTLCITSSNAQNYPKLIKVTGGTFTMGDNHGLGDKDEHPTHKVTLSDFSIGKTEVTVAQYRNYCLALGIPMPKEPSWGWSDNAPIVNVSWYDALKYCKWLSEMLDRKISLPTEAQWEFAARGGNQSEGYKFAGGNSMELNGWYTVNSNHKTHRVATKKANELGLYDMNGNAWEWCLDWYSNKYYEDSPSKDPQNTSRGVGKKVLRGGSWKSFTSFCRITERYFIIPENIKANFGFRVVSY